MFGLNTKKEARLVKRMGQLESRIVQLMDEKYSLEERVDGLKLENKKLSTKRQIEEEQIAHKIKMREEQVDLNFEKRVAKIEGEKQKAIAKVKDDYRDKTEKQLEKRGDELKKMYSEILMRLPDVSMAISKEIKTKS